MTTTSVPATQSAATTPPARPRWGLLLALVLVVGPVLQIVQMTLEPGHDSVEERVAYWVGHETRIGLAMAAGVIAVPFLIGSTLILVRMTRQRMPRLSITAGCLMVMALVSLAALQGSEQAAYWMLLADDREAAVALLGISDPGIPGIALIVMMMSGAVFGTIAFVVVMWRSPEVPRVATVAKLSWLITDFLIGIWLVPQGISLFAAVVLAWALVTGYRRHGTAEPVANPA